MQVQSNYTNIYKQEKNTHIERISSIIKLKQYTRGPIKILLNTLKIKKKKNVALPEQTL